MSIQEQIKDEMIKAMKEKRTEAKNTYSLFLSKLKNKAIELRVDNLSDLDAITEAKKFIKLLNEEKELNYKLNRADAVDTLTYKISLISKYIPQQLGENEIREIINKQADKSIKSIMIFFKTNYQGKADMGLVNKIAKEYAN